MSVPRLRLISQETEDQATLDEFILPGSRSRSPAKIRIRRYQEGDKGAIRSICCETGFLGQPIDAIYRDRELFADLLTGAYLEHEPEWTLVAEIEGKVVAYLLGSVNTRFKLTLMLNGFQTVCKMLRRLLTGRYSDHPRSEQFVRWVLTRGLAERPKHPENAAHLHLNVDKAYRGRTIARRFWTIFEEMLKSAGMTRCYGEFYSCKYQNPERVYSRYGFELFHKIETTIFYPEIAAPISTTCLSKKLEPFR